MAAFQFDNKVIEITSGFKPYAINLTKDPESAKDLIQETVLKALSNRDKFREGTNLSAWLFTIMRNIFINAYRKKSKRKTITDGTDNQYYINSVQTIVKNQAEQNFMMDDIKKAIGKLSDEFRIPFMLHYEGFKYLEISEELDLPLGTVKSRIFFARKQLKTTLAIYKANK